MRACWAASLTALFSYSVPGGLPTKAPYSPCNDSPKMERAYSGPFSTTGIQKTTRVTTVTKTVQRCMSQRKNKLSRQSPKRAVLREQEFHSVQMTISSRLNYPLLFTIKFDATLERLGDYEL